MLQCATCQHWQGGPSSYSAECAKGVYTALVAFDRCDPPCPLHSHAPTAAPDMQSQARGTPIPMVQMFVPGVKP